MKLNDLVTKIDENADEFADKTLLDGGCINHLYHLTINSEKFEFSRYNRAFDEEYDGVYFRVEDSKDKPYMTTLPQYKNYMVEDYTVEYNSEKHYNGLDLHIYLDIKLRERKYPTLEEFMNTYMKDVPVSQKHDGEDKYTSILVYKGELYRRSPDNMFRFRNYKVHRCYYGRLNGGTWKEPHYYNSPWVYVIFLRD